MRAREFTRDAKVLALGVYGLFGYHFCLFLALRLAAPVEANLANYLWPVPAWCCSAARRSRARRRARWC